MTITLAAVTVGIFTACLAPLGCTPTAAPAMTPCEGTHVIVHGFDTPTNCDLTPPQELHVTVEHVAPWTPEQAAEFDTNCANAGGTPTDTDGDAWQCSSLDY